MRPRKLKDDPALALGERLVTVLPFELACEVALRFNAVCQARAPAHYSDALGELEVYLSALTDAGLLPLELQVAIKEPLISLWEKMSCEMKVLTLSGVNEDA